MATIPQYLPDEQMQDYLSSKSRIIEIENSIIRFEASIQDMQFETEEAKLAVMTLVAVLKKEYEALKEKVEKYQAIIDAGIEKDMPTDFNALPTNAIK